jgi:hypothetical protein
LYLSALAPADGAAARFLIDLSAGFAGLADLRISVVAAFFVVAPS